MAGRILRPLEDPNLKTLVPGLRGVAEKPAPNQRKPHQGAKSCVSPEGGPAGNHRPPKQLVNCSACSGRKTSAEIGRFSSAAKSWVPFVIVNKPHLGVEVADRDVECQKTAQQYQQTTPLRG